MDPLESSQPVGDEVLVENVPQGTNWGTAIVVASVVAALLWGNTRRLFRQPIGGGQADTSSLQSAGEVPAGQSNLADEFTCDASGGPVEDWKVKSLWIYPIKSCRGVELLESRVVETGLEYDRQFTFAEFKFDPKIGKDGWVFITQRQYPLLARIVPTIKSQKGIAGGQASLTVSYSTESKLAKLFGIGGAVPKTFNVPLDINYSFLKNHPLQEVRIWKEVVLAYNLSDLIPADFAQSFGCKNPVSLFRMPPTMFREVYRCAPKKEDLGYQPVTAFADAYPIHLINLASVRDLNSKITESIPELSARRFRSNIIVSGPAAFQEDDWKLVKIGSFNYHTVCRTMRCKLPNVNQDTGERHPAEPDRTMRKYRCIDAGNKLNAAMGMQVVPASKEGIIRVGDPISVLETGEHYYIDQ